MRDAPQRGSEKQVMPSAHERQKNILGGWLCAGVGLLTAGMIYQYPEQLHAPAWVAYLASAAFICAGLTIVTQAYPLPRTSAWLTVACVASLFSTGAWVAFGAGLRACTVSLPCISALGTTLMCRGAFGVGTLMVGVLLIHLIRQAGRV